MAIFLGVSNPRRAGFTVAVLVGGCLLAACDAPPQPGGRAMITDSAGVTIVENHDPLWSGAAAWRVDPDPVTRIGEGTGTNSGFLYETRGAARLDDGRIAVLSGGNAALQFHDPQGDLLASVGGQGQGPGDLGQAVNQLLRLPGDTLLVVSIPSRQVTRFDGEGNYLDRHPFDPEPALAFMGSYRAGDLVHLLPEGGLLAQARVDTRDPQMDGLPGGFVIVSADGRGSLVEPFPYGVGGFLGRASLHAAGGRPVRVALAYNERYDISIFSPSGVPLLRVRNARPNDPVLEEDLARARARVTDEAAFDAAERPDTWPAFDALVFDRDGNLWVRRHFPGAYDPDSVSSWDVYDANGMLLTTVVLPGMIYTVYDIGEDFVLGRVAVDEFGSEEVRLYRLDRGAR